MPISPFTGAGIGLSLQDDPDDVEPQEDGDVSARSGVIERSDAHVEPFHRDPQETRTEAEHRSPAIESDDDQTGRFELRHAEEHSDDLPHDIDDGDF